MPETAAWRPSARPPLARRLERVARAALGRLRPRLRVLSVIHAGGGGAVHTNEDLMRALSRSCDAYILAAGPRKWTLSRARHDGADRIQEISFSDTWAGQASPSPARIAAFDAALEALKPDVVHIRDVLGIGPEMIARAKRAGARVVVSFHDYLAICPNIKLLDADFIHCAGQCTPGASDCSAPQKWFPALIGLKHAYVHEWRARVGEALAHADAFVTTSAQAAALLSEHFPALEGRISLIEHGRDLVRQSVARPPGARPCVIALNVIDRAKGADLVAALATLNQAGGAPFALHMLGGDAASALPGVIHHGPYGRDGLATKLAAIGPSFSLIPSLWPETYSHTLTESWAAGIPVLASDLGAPADRIRRHGGGWVLDPHQPTLWLETMHAATRSPALWASKVGELNSMQLPAVREMADAYIALYEKCAIGQGLSGTEP